MAASYGEAYLLIFVTCIYSTGLPILMFFAFFGFTCVVTHTRLTVLLSLLASARHCCWLPPPVLVGCDSAR